VRITVPSFSKTNWLLQILGRRSDGYHELLTVLQTLDYSDDLVFEVPHSEIQLSTEGREVAGGEENLVQIAARLLKRECGTAQGVRITLTKRIPVGAGLGGGSSNAAMALLVLNQLWSCGLTKNRLLQLARRLGSDVPFFLTGGTAIGWGRGEQITPLADLSREFWILVYYPRFQISTAEAYSRVRNLPGKLTRPPLGTTIRRFQKALDAGSWSVLRNDLEGPVFLHCPLLAQKKRELLSAGCEFGMLSGSGSALIGVSSSGSLERVEDRLRECGNADVFVCRTLSRKRYFDSLKRAGVHTDLLMV